MVDRRVVVTGASSGIGKEIARNLAYFGASVVLGCRSRDRGSAALHELVEDSENDRLSMLIVDVSSQESVRSFAKMVCAGGPIHVLINNAGILTAERQISAEGLELTWATNALGYFMVTNLLLPQLKKSGPARVINVASRVAGHLDIEDLNFERRKFAGARAYAQSKQANRMLSWGLADRVTHGDVSVHACHPGGVDTQLYREQKGVLGKILGAGASLMKSPASGAITPTWLACDPDVHECSNQFWVNKRIGRCKFRNKEQTDMLWKKCVEMTHTDAA